MPQLTGYVWNVSLFTGKKMRVLTEGHNLDEAVSEFRRIHGYEHAIYQIKYHDYYGGEIND